MVARDKDAPEVSILCNLGGLFDCLCLLGVVLLSGLASGVVVVGGVGDWSVCLHCERIVSRVVGEGGKDRACIGPFYTARAMLQRICHSTRYGQNKVLVKELCDGPPD